MPTYQGYRYSHTERHQQTPRKTGTKHLKNGVPDIGQSMSGTPFLRAVEAHHTQKPFVVNI